MEEHWVAKTEATVAAVRLMLPSLGRVLADRLSSCEDLKKVIVPFFALDWSREVVLKVGGRNLSQFYARLRVSKIDPDLLKKFYKLVKDAPVNTSAIFQPELERWRSLIVSRSLTRFQCYADWRDTVELIRDKGFDEPHDFAKCTRAEIKAYDLGQQEEMWVRLWLNTRDPHEGSSREVSGINSSDKLYGEIAEFRKDKVSDTGVAVKRRKMLDELQLGEGFEGLGPAAKIRRLRDSRIEGKKLEEFCETGAKINILNQTRDSLRSVASGIQCYASFCELWGEPFMPPREDMVRRWSSIFSPGKTFSIYVSHLEKACQMESLGCEWLTPEIRALGKGLKNAADNSRRFTNSVSEKEIRSLLRVEPLDSSQIGRLAVISYTFLLRVGSEAIPMIRAPLGHDLLSKDSQEEMSVVGLREHEGEMKLIVKLKKRKNIRQACVMMRPCCCGLDCFVPLGLCPIHDWWHQIKRDTLPGEKIFPDLSKRNLNRILKANFLKAGIKDAERFSSHAFRRGAVQAILDSGASFGQIIKSGRWSSAAFRGYLSFEKEEEINIKEILTKTNRRKEKGEIEDDSNSD